MQDTAFVTDAQQLPLVNHFISSSQHYPMPTTPKRISQQALFKIEEHPQKPEQTPLKKGDGIFDIMDALTAPILTFSQLWADVIPKRLLKQVPMARMIALMKGQQSATDVECVIYLYTRTHEAPMDRDWVDIYTHLSCRTLEDYFNEDHWNEINAPRELTEWLQRELNGLREFIYRKRRELLRQRLKVKKNERETEDIPDKPHAPVSPTTHQASFDF
ncbi:hypothetical protein [Chitinophaga cymbidii]|uniref:Uncharacterized protein n=1 Tax=Chitinophaga cymbidii TaxID=1096750 RepID=A0A512RPR0_9BACT|nr:hypothetical protein [Chitinophaga cymbidii]GEP97682.1 hypothetical protein CCY01nite_39420 [Chitinophaga cymbidii]